MSQTYQAVVAGHLCLDIVPHMSPAPSGGLAELLQPGRLVDVGPVTLATGGPVSNTGLTLNKIGIPTYLMGKIGADLFGQAVRQVVASFGPELPNGMIVDPAVATSYTVIISPPGVDRVFLHCPAANDAFRASDIRYDLVGQMRLFHFGYPPLMAAMFEAGSHELADIFRRVKALGVTTSLDMALPDPASPAGRANWPAILGETLPLVDIFVPSIEEILFTLRKPAYTTILERGLAAVTPNLLNELSGELLTMGPKIVMLKLGDRGIYLRTAGAAALAALGPGGPADPVAWADRELWAPCFQAQLVGTAGSGDATIAGFLSALLRGMGPEEAATAAVAVGVCNVEAADTLSGVRTWEATQERIAAGWPRHPLDLAALEPAAIARGWRWDEHWQLWLGPGNS